MLYQILLNIIHNILHIKITSNSVSKGFIIIIWFLMPADLCSKVYVGWTIWKTSFIIFLDIVCLSNVLNHLLCSIAIHHELFNMDEKLFIISFTCKQTIIGYWSILQCINIQSNPHISISSTWSESQVYHIFSEWWYPCRTRTFHNIQGPDI